MNTVLKERLVLLGIYVAAFAVGIFIGNSYMDLNVLGKTMMAIFAIVLILWLFSFLSDNSSIFDPYWSVAPPILMLFMIYQANEGTFLNSAYWTTHLRVVLILILVTIYGVRLTYNFLRGWEGMHHEDWRYQDLRQKTGMMYWTVSFLALHLFPATMVFLGSLSIWVAVSQDGQSLGILDIVGMGVAGMAIYLEAKSDKQLHDFVKSNKEPGKTMDQGVWSISRHPNYLGEMSFWWGLYFFALATNPAFWWVIIGPGAITLMFLFASIPMIEKRLMVRKKDYADYKKRVPMILPLKLGR